MNADGNEATVSMLKKTREVDMLGLGEIGQFAGWKKGPPSHPISGESWKYALDTLRRDWCFLSWLVSSRWA
jgi:hypothetical protein